MNRLLSLSLTLGISLSLTGCELVGDILEFGFWAGIIFLLVVIAGIALVVWLLKNIF